MDLDNPTADDLIVVGAAQRNRLNALNVLPIWSDEDMEDIVLAHHQWSEILSAWAVPVSALLEMGLDGRTPAGYSLFLLDMVQWAHVNDQTHIHPKSKYNDTSN